jgi:hypothetical protein
MLEGFIIYSTNTKLTTGLSTENPQSLNVMGPRRWRPFRITHPRTVPVRTGRIVVVVVVVSGQVSLSRQPHRQSHHTHWVRPRESFHTLPARNKHYAHAC